MPDNLIDLAKAKAAIANYTGTAQDAAIQSLIKAASRAIERYCKRRFLVADYDELYDALGIGSLLLNNFPVLSLGRIALAPERVLTIKNTLNPRTQVSRVTVETIQNSSSLANDYPALSLGIRLTRVDSTGTSNTDGEILWASYPTVQDVATQINTLSANGWEATVQGSYGIWRSADINAVQGSRSCLGSGAKLTIHTNDLTEFDLVPETGEIRFTNSLDPMNFSAGWSGVSYNTELLPGTALPRGNQYIRVAYTAGFYDVPDDVERACAMFVAWLFKQPEFVGGLVSEHLGDYSYQRQITEGMPSDVKSLLAPYRDHRA